MTSGRAIALLLGLGLALPACGKTQNNAPPVAVSGGGGETAPGQSGGTTGGASIGGGASTAGTAGEPPKETACEDALRAPGPGPLTRLGNDQLNRSLRALLPEESTTALGWLSESSFENDGAQPLAPDFLRRLHSLAHDLARQLTADTSSRGWLAGCDVSALGEEECREALTKPLLERAYRRPATEEDLEEMSSVFAAGKRQGGDFASGMRAIVEVALQNPDSVYLVELGNGKDDNGSTPLTGFESAARLAYFLTRSPPDPELSRVAARGPLSEEELETQARRLLATTGSRSGLSHYYSLVLDLEAGPNRINRDVPLELAPSITEGSRRFVEEAFFDHGGSLRTLLTAPWVWTDGPLAKFYGYEVEGTDWQRVARPPAVASGVLTQPAFLSTSGERASLQRGARILAGLLCQPRPTPPAQLPTVSPPSLLDTERGWLERVTSPAECAACHRDMNQLGFALEHYDHAGRWRDLDHGVPVDSSGTWERAGLRDSFAGAPELMELLAESDAVKSCFVRRWLEAGYGRPFQEETDSCRLQQSADAWSESDGGVVELLVQIAQTPRFRYRATAELAP
jgi:hypothetical protein